MARRGQTVRISSKGQVVIPASIRKELGLKTGRTLRVRSTSKKEIVLSLPEANEAFIEEFRRRAAEWAKRTGRDLVEELHERRRKEREEERRRGYWGR
ncbi:MAG: AbrB/MazE/SpoVT family DNA-binding domain-containing protein [Myxococcales bacterium]|nr:AbrB/MazE/SpoVT family DNA-binding domain-containing protein [Myxococcales bacterium]